jgi:predicted nucleic acid-binding Zn ribbon protein
MPIYEFKCETCGHRFETIQNSKAPPPPCPNPDPEQPPGAVQAIFHEPPTACGGPSERVISQSTFHLKGSGWASDGYQ